MLWQYSTGVVTSIDFSALYSRAVGTGGTKGRGSDTLTLFETWEGADYARYITTRPSRFAGLPTGLLRIVNIPLLHKHFWAKFLLGNFFKGATHGTRHFKFIPHGQDRRKV